MNSVMQKWEDICDELDTEQHMIRLDVIQTKLYCSHTKAFPLNLHTNLLNPQAHYTRIRAVDQAVHNIYTGH